MLRTTGFFAAALGAMLVAAPAGAATLFFDDFDSGASAAWGNQRGNWRDTGGLYDATNPTNSPLTYTDVTTLPALTDFTLDVDINAVDDGGVWLRSDFNGGAINGVLLVTGGSTGSNNGLYWHVFTNGGASGILNPGAFAGLQDSNRHLRVEVSGDTYSAYIGDTLVTTLVDATHGAGSAGLYDFSPTNGATSPRGQTFDNFSITVAMPEPALAGLGGLVLAALGLMRRRR